MTMQTLTARSGRRRGIVLTLAALLLAGAVAGAWFWYRWSATAPIVPPMPSAVEEGEVRHAIETARSKVLDNPRSADAWGRLGMTLLAQLFDREAEQCFAEAARLDPNDPRWAYGQARIALKRQPDRALPLLRQAVRAAASSSPQQLSNYRLPLAETLLERGELDEAEQLFRTEQRDKPSNPRAAFGLGLIAAQRGDTRTAVELLTIAKASPFAQKLATAQLAALARGDGDHAAAERYEKEVAALPNDPPWTDPFLDHVIQLRVGRRRLEHDVDELEKQEHFAEAANIWLAELEQRRTARACIGAAINLDRLGDYERALSLLHEALHLDPDSVQAHYTLALTLFTRAEREWQQTPGCASARKGFRESIPPARRTTQLKTDYAQAYLFWGLAHKYLDEPAEAVAPLRQGVACQPNSLELQLALGEVLLTIGQRKEAETHLENARRLDPEDPRVVRALKHLHVNKP